MSPDTLLAALVKRRDVANLTAVSNNAGAGDSGLGAYPQRQENQQTQFSTGKLFNTKQIDKIIASYPGGSVNHLFQPLRL